MNSGLRMEDDYLHVLLKFKSKKARLIKMDLFKNIEPGILEVNPEKEEKVKNVKVVKKKQEVFKKRRQERGSVVSDVLFNRGSDFYVPIEKIEESVLVSEKGPTHTFKPNRETMHMMIKKAISVKHIETLFCENFDGYKRLDVEKIDEDVTEGEND